MGREVAPLGAETRVDSHWDLPSWWVTTVSLPWGCVPSWGRAWGHCHGAVSPQVEDTGSLPCGCVPSWWMSRPWDCVLLGGGHEDPAIGLCPSGRCHGHGAVFP